MTVAAFVILDIVLLAVWPNPDDRAALGGSDTRRARVLVISLSWLFMGLAVWMQMRHGPLPGWLCVMAVGSWLVPGIWSMEREVAQGGSGAFFRGAFALFVAPPAVCVASVVAAGRRAPRP